MASPASTVAAADLPALAAAPLGAGTAEPAALATATPHSPLFITTQSCPYAQRTWLALNEAGLPYTPVFVDLQKKAEWHLKLNPFGRVPTLAWWAEEDEEGSGKKNKALRSLYESLICDEFVSELKGGALLPPTASAAAGMRLLIDQFGARFGPAFAGLLFAEDGSDKAREAAGKVDEALGWLEQNTAAPAGGGSASSAADGTSPSPLFLLGQYGLFTLADAAIYPFVARLRGVMPRLAPKCAAKYGDLRAAGFPKVGAWLERTAARPGVRATEVAPAGSAGYWEALEETYVAYRARQQQAAAAAAAAAAK